MSQIQEESYTNRILIKFDYILYRSQERMGVSVRFVITTYENPFTPLDMNSETLRFPRSVLTRKQGTLQQHPAILLSEQEFLRLNGGVRVKKLVKTRIRGRGTILVRGNLGILKGKTMELVDVLRRRNIDITCHQEIKLSREKPKELGQQYQLL